MADELCYSSTCNFINKPSFFFFYDLSFICSFIFSHPLYFSYFLFFSPYLFKIISFISPLFFTTALVLLLSFLTTTFPPPKLGFIQTVIDRLRSKLNEVDDDEEEFPNFEDFEIYKIVFHDPPLITVGDGDNFNEEMSVMENAVAVTVTVEDKPEVERSLESFFEELDHFEDSTAAIETPEKESSSDLEKIVEVEKSQKTESLVKKKLESKSMAVVESEADQTPFDKSFSVKSNSCRVDSASSFGSYGSMRKEKEWKRTLACKLFEERHNSEGGEEGMDSLWEAYDDDNSSRKSKNRKEPMINQKKTMMKNKKIEFKYFDDDLEEDDEEEFMSNGQLCCLKALKLSAGKMNLGMGKPNLVKISKALKGFGWLHHVGSKHGKRI